MIAVYTNGPFKGLNFDPDRDVLDVEWRDLSTLLRAHCMAFIGSTHKKSQVYAEKGITVYQDANGFELSVDIMLDLWIRSWTWEYPMEEPDNPVMVYPFSQSDIPAIAPVTDYQKDINLDALIAELDDPQWEEFNDDNRNTMLIDLDLDEDGDDESAVPIVELAKVTVGLKSDKVTVIGSRPNLAHLAIEIGKRFAMARSKK